MSRHFKAGEILIDDTDAFRFDIEFQDVRPPALTMKTPLIYARILVPVLPGETSAEPARERARLLRQALLRIL